MWPFGNSTVQRIAADKQHERDEKLQPEKDKAKNAASTAAKSSVYLSATATEIVENIRSKRWTAVEVLEAYIARAVEAQVLTNCLTEVFIEEARKDAVALDKHFQETNELKGPLHGVPVSFKDLFDIAGYDSTIGFSKFAHHPAEADAEVVKLVREAGGILFVKTNVPQTMMFFECSNPVWGRTSNPYNPAHTAGGSSGGESALLAMDGCALGWGTDIGGSLRIPMHYCGVYALKPTRGRISTSGAQDPLFGFEAIGNLVGPIARSVADVELASRLTFGRGTGDVLLVPMPYRDVQLPEKLRIGYYTSDDYLKCSPACERAILETVDALRKAGHECIEIPAPKSSRAIQIYTSLLTSDGNKTLFTPMGSDPREMPLTSLALLPKLDWFTRSLVSFITKNFYGDTFAAQAPSIVKKKSVTEYWRSTRDARNFAKDFDKQVWDKYTLDGIIGPAQAVPAMAHNASTMVQTISSATILYNVLDLPVGAVPITRVDPGKDQLTPDFYKPRSPEDSAMTMQFLYKGDKAVYNADKMAGLPVGIQVVGRRWEDEKVIELMKVIDTAVGPRDFGPGSWQRVKERLDKATSKISASTEQ